MSKKSKKNIRGYKPLSDSFCKSIIKNSSNNLVEDPNNKYVLIYNSDKSAYIRREYDAGGSVLLGFKVETDDISYTIDKNKNIFDIVVEMLRFGFSYTQIKGLVNITHKQYETYKPKDFNSMNDFIFMLGVVPKSLYRCNDVLHYIKHFPELIIENSSAELLSKAANISKTQAKKCFELYNSKHYSHLLSEAKKRKAANKNVKAEVNVTEKVVTTANKAVVKEEVISEVEKKEEILGVGLDSENISSDTSIISNIEDENSELNMGQEVETSDLELSQSELQNEVKVIKEDEQDQSMIEQKFESLVEEVSLSVETESINEDVDIANLEDSKLDFIPIMQEYQDLFGFAGIPFDYNSLKKDLVENLSKMSFSEYIETYNKMGFMNMLYPIVYLGKVFNYSRPFTLAEDRILELYYKEIGVLVVDVLKSVIPNYTVRSNIEYIYRIRECNVKCPHPLNGFELLDEDIAFIKALYPKVKKRPTKYFSWFDSYDLSYYACALNLGEASSKKTKKIIEKDEINIQYYIDSALKLKEIIYYNDFWTTEKHEFFKEEFKNRGLAVLNLIPGLTEEECLEHSKQYKIFQNYTDKELLEIKSVYMEGGLDAVIKAFTYRTETALKYKIEEEGWAEERNAFLIEQEIENRLQKKLSESIETIREEIINNESALIEQRLREELKPTIKAEVIKEFSSLVKGSIFQTLKLEIPNLIRKSHLKDIPNMLPQKIITRFEALIQDSLGSLK